MVKPSGGEEGQLHLSYTRDSLHTAWYARASLPSEWGVSYYTALGDDSCSNAMLALMTQGQINTDLVRLMPNKRSGLSIIHQKDGDRHFTNSLFESTQDVEEDVDATGAGDTFNGAYLAAPVIGYWGALI